MSLVPARNVWLTRQQNLKGSSSSTMDGSKSNQNASTNANDLTSMADVTDDKAWPQVNINSPSKIKEKAREKGVLSPSATTNGIITDSSPKKSDKGRPKWAPNTPVEASSAPLPNSIGSSVLAMTSNHASPRPKSPIVESTDTSVADDTLGFNPQVAASDLHIEPRIEEQWPSVPTPPPQLQRQLSPQHERPLKLSSPHLHPTSPSKAQPVILQSYPSFPESSYAYQMHPYPIYDHSSAYPYLPYASSSSSAQYPPYPSEPMSYLFPGQMPVPVPYFGQPTGDASFVAAGAATVFGAVEPCHEKRLPPFGVGCADRKGKRRRANIADGGVVNERRRRHKSPFLVSARGSSGNKEITDLTSWSGIGEELQSPVLGSSESENFSQRRNKRRWSFFWDGVHLVDVFHYHSSCTHLQQSQHQLEGPSYGPYYSYPYYQHPLHAHAPPYPLPFQPAAPLHYPSIYSHSYHHQQHHQLLPQQPFPVYAPFFNTQGAQPYLQPPLPSENENPTEIPDEGIPIPSATTTTILVSASPNSTESGSIKSYTSSPPMKPKKHLGVSSSDSSTPPTSLPSAEESDSSNKLPPLSALPTLNNLPTLGSIPTPIEGRNELVSAQDPAARHSPSNSTFTLNPTHDPFVPSTLAANPSSRPTVGPSVDERRILFQQSLDQDDDSFRVRDFRRPNVIGWAPEVGPEQRQFAVQTDEQRGGKGMIYPRAQPLVHTDNDEPQPDELRTRRDFEFQRSGYRHNGRMMDDWRGSRGFRGRGFRGGRGRAGFRGRGFGFPSGPPPPPFMPRETYEMPMGASNGMNNSVGPTPPRYNRRGRGSGLFVPPTLDMQHLHDHQNHLNISPSQITPPQDFSTSPYASRPSTSHPSPLIPQANLHTPPSQFHVPAHIPVQGPAISWTAQHPWPTPLTPLANIPILLDEVRYRLLGQLEYYLSAENMVKDMWLRGRMSPEGWIPLSVIMTFNRIKQLTDNLHLVKEVLGFSEHVEVMDDGDPDEASVRMRNGAWQSYLLPPPVVVKMEAPPDKLVSPAVNGNATARGSPPQVPHVNGNDLLAASAKYTPVPAAAVASDESEVEEDIDSDEDDVVFVMGSEGGGWSRAASGERGT